MLAGTLTPLTANLVQQPRSIVTVTDVSKLDDYYQPTTIQCSINNINKLSIPKPNCSPILPADFPSSIDSEPSEIEHRPDTSGRSAALERAYVHDVYENCDESTGSIRPRVAQFLAGLDPGAIVCDVGCGNGRYLTGCNPNILTLGVDRCYRLARVSRDRGGDVTLCDNLDLPFRDESFDAVLSLAVVHHFATTERRVGAIRELARILRIGGRVVISVWALEQKQRRFECQDVLIPWQPPMKGSNFSDDEEDDNFLPPYHAYTEDSTNSSRSAGDGDSSSLSSSSPGESCYSFVRRAIQKLAGGKKHPWFLDSWNSKDTKTNSSLEYEDARDLPIELRRLEDFDDFTEPPLSAGLKSRSLGSILNPPPRQIVRSRSSVPSLGAQIAEKQKQQTITSATSQSSTGGVDRGADVRQSPLTVPDRRPKLIKQKQSLCDDEFQLADDDSVFGTAGDRTFLRKQSSLNEELMAENRLREKERVRKRIHKQMSLNEAFLCRSVFTKRLQVIREGFTTKLKTSTGTLERATKNGFVKIMQNLKATGAAAGDNRSADSQTGVGGESKAGTVQQQHLVPGSCVATVVATNPMTNSVNSVTSNNDDEQKIRRHSRESGSDSSKDSSLQSDTSIESEDSFASVIFIPKPDTAQSQQQQQQQKSDRSEGSVPNRTPSVPTSPLIMPCPPTPAHSPAPYTANALQTSPPIVVNNMTSNKLLTSGLGTVPPQRSDKMNRFTFDVPQIISTDASSNFRAMADRCTRSVLESTPKLERITRQIVQNLPPIPKFNKNRSTFPIVRREAAAQTVPKFTSLEIFNPETDDLDSDSSEPSSPDSIDSVIDATKSQEKSESVDMVTESVVVEPAVADGGDSDKQEYVNFAEQLSAQLLKELDRKIDSIESLSPDWDGSSPIINDSKSIVDDPYIRKLNGEIRELNSLREELRERRLMLANINPHHYYLNCSANNNNTSTSSTIHEEDESLSPNRIEDIDELDEDKLDDGHDTVLLIPADDNDDDDDDDDQVKITEQITVTTKPGSGRPMVECSIGSLGHSTSTTSLDSPSVGGRSTHHRYYHVFREGELDSLINHHVTSLHIVSSYYERASWCVVAEKVQVWTI